MVMLERSRPADTRPPHRDDDARPGKPHARSPRTFDELLGELAATRLSYERARSSAAERAALRTRLHELRAALAENRRAEVM